MNKIMIGLLCIVIILITGCLGPNPPDDLSRYKGIAWAEIPGECLEFRDDVCGLFECMVDGCWCDDSSPQSPIIYEKDVMIANKEEAMALVDEYLNEKVMGGDKLSSEYEYIEVKRAVELNNIFYNVFADDKGDELVYTVAVDGTIIKTICGV